LGRTSAGSSNRDKEPALPHVIIRFSTENLYLQGRHGKHEKLQA
jgi:hypothetical protein